jgi:NAD(P)-dependent dehydrogenase (short-subunit alcohol dehydrogenase family)
MKTVLITGSSGGLGQGLVNFYHKKGWFVIGVDRIKSDNPLIHLEMPLDISEIGSTPPKIIKLLEENKIGKIDALINNAAIQIKKKIQDIEYNDWKTTLDTNLVAPFILVQKLQEYLYDGCVVNISSIHATQTKKDFLLYATSKGALTSLTKCLALELAPKISVNAILPAAIETNMLKAGLSEKDYKLLQKFHPTKNIGEPEGLSKLVYYLCEKNDFLTGACIEYDGGISKLLHDPETI